MSDLEPGAGPGSAVARVPDRWLPAPGIRELPEPPPLRRMLGPSVILAGLSIGSGEFVLWPRLTAQYGFELFWACWVGVTLQFFLNMEIERWSLATGESAVVGFMRLSRVFGPLFFVCATLPWIWPGWATGAAVLLHWETGAPVVPVAIAGLVACGLLLSLGPVVYRTVERIQFVLVGTIFVGLVILAGALVRAETVAALLAGALRFGSIPDGVELAVLFGALAFAGAGGAVNLAQSNYIKDKGFGMGRYVGRITSPLTGREEAASEVGAVFAGTPAELGRWRLWWRRTNLEHLLSFYALCLICMALFCLLAATLLGPGAAVGEGLEFIREEARAVEGHFGAGGRVAFLGLGVLVLFSTELALLDAVSRVAADILQTGLFRERAVGLSRLYFGVLWSLVAIGAVVLAAGFDRPLVLLVLSACLNGFVMFLYSGTLLWLNGTSFRSPLRPSPGRLLALLAALLFFGYFSVLTALDQLG